MALTVTVNKIAKCFEHGTEKGILYSIQITDYQTGGTDFTGLFPGIEKAKAVLGTFPGQVISWAPSTQKMTIYESGTASASLDELDANDDTTTGVFLVIGN